MVNLGYWRFRLCVLGFSVNFFFFVFLFLFKSTDQPQFNLQCVNNIWSHFTYKIQINISRPQHWLNKNEFYIFYKKPNDLIFICCVYFLTYLIYSRIIFLMILSSPACKKLKKKYFNWKKGFFFFIYNSNEKLFYFLYK